MTMTIDTQIWIYNFDSNAREHKYVQKWLREEMAHTTISMSVIIPMEVAHNLYRVPNLESMDIENLLLKWITHENMHLIDMTHQILFIAFDMLKSYREKRIGSRDCVILATMFANNIDTIATHDKNILTLNDLNRIDPVFTPPLKLKKGQELDTTVFQKS